MKKLNFIVLCVSTLLSSNISLADGMTETRTNCSFLNDKYQARSRVTLSGVPNTDKETACPQVTQNESPGAAALYTGVSNACANQYANNVWGDESQWGAVTKWYWICSRGLNNSSLYYNLVDSRLKEEPIGYEKSKVSCENTFFNDENIVKKNMNASFSVLGKDLFSSLEIIMWLPNKNEQDSIITAEKTFWQGKLELINGEVKLIGDFPKDSYQLSSKQTEDGIEFTVTIEAMNLVVEYPEGITKDDLIAVRMITDAGVHEEKAFEDALTTSDLSNPLIISCYPNPTTDLINLTFGNTLTKEPLDLYLYDIKGKELYSRKDVNEGTISLSLKSFNLPSGMYYILIKNGTSSHLEKLILEN